MKVLNGKKVIYYQGDKAIITGKIVVLYGGHFLEIKIIEGHNKDKIRHISPRYLKRYFNN